MIARCCDVKILTMSATPNGELRWSRNTVRHLGGYVTMLPRSSVMGLRPLPWRRRTTVPIGNDIFGR